VKPSITVDERGVLLHVIGKDGEGVAIPLDPGTIIEMWGALGRALKTPNGRTTFLRGLGRILGELTMDEEKGKDGGA
jgi:hypothetical protein